jgi:hypothetical protein
VESWNFTVQREFKGGFTGSVGYVGAHDLKMNAPYNINYGQVGGGPASDLLFPYGITGTANVLLPVGAAKYHSLQTAVNKRMGNGLSLQAAYTFSHETGMCCNGTSSAETSAPSILIPQYQLLNRATMPYDITHNVHVGAVYELPFGKGKKFASNRLVNAIAGGWSTNGIVTVESGLPFWVTAANASLNAPGSSQRADLIKSNVSILNGVGPAPYFDPTAFAPVTTARFGTSGFDILRGPHHRNLDFSVFRTFPLPFQGERFKIQFRAEVFNLTNTPHFNPPTSSGGGGQSTNVSNLSLNTDGSVRALNGYDQITATTPLGRLLDPRYFRFGLRLMW